MTTAEGPMHRMVLYSIGHSNHSADELVGLLKAHDIDAVADVRTSPFSRYSPQFNQGALKATLVANRIAYVFMGKELGGRPTGAEFYDHEGHVRYDRLSQTALFEQGLDRLLRGAAAQRVSMLCSEGDPTQCHRHLLIARVLDARGIEVVHVTTDGALISYREAAAKAGAAQLGLFDAPEEESTWRSPLPVSPDTPQSPSSES